MATVIKDEVTKKQVFSDFSIWLPRMPVGEYNHYITIVKTNNDHYYKISSVFTADHGYETMIFECRPDGVGGWFSDWEDLFVANYDTEADMASDHKRLVDNFDNLHLEHDDRWFADEDDEED